MWVCGVMYYVESCILWSHVLCGVIYYVELCIMWSHVLCGTTHYVEPCICRVMYSMKVC